MKTENSYKVSVLVLGFSAITVQIIFLREFLTVFNGNELVIGVILANWMLLTGLGSFLGKFSEKIKNSAAAVITIHLLMGLLPFIIVFLIKYLKNIIFPPGSMIGLIQVLYGSFIVMAPFCIISGFLFSLLCSIVSKHFKTNKISYIYALEAVGSITGGLLFNLILIYFFSVFQSLIILLFINFIISLIICFLSKLKITGYIFIILACSLAFLCIYYDFDRITAEFLFQTKNIVVNKDTPYGNLVITKTEEQINFFEDGILLFSSGSPQQNEEDIHYALIQRTKYENVLLISGGITGTLKEIQKYKPACIDYIEINPWLLYYAGKYAGFMPDSNVNLITSDARIFIKDRKKKYDAVLINLPPPETARLNRFYTAEFFESLKLCMNKNAVISTGLASTINYVSEEAARINSSLYKTLKKTFKNVLLVPGYKNYFLASDSALFVNIAEKISTSGIENVYVNQYYIDDALLKDRSNFILKHIDNTASVNYDFTPVAFYEQLLFWLSHFKTNYSLIIVILVLILVFSFIRMNPLTFGMFTGGFTASSVEIVLLLAFQIIYGYVYLVAGLIITIFMAGLAAGAFLLPKIFRKITYTGFFKIQIFNALYCFLLPLILFFLKNYVPGIFVVHCIIFLLAFILAFAVGLEFAISSKLSTKTVSVTTAELYSQDMTGSAIGALLVSVLLIPLVGITYACFLTGVLNIISACVILMFKGNRSIISGFTEHGTDHKAL